MTSEQNLSRREALAWIAGIAATAAAPLKIAAVVATPIAVYKDPSCGCCEGWVAHMKAHGFAPSVTNDATATADVKKKYGVPLALQSCHTAVVAGYVVEGHVPATDVRKLLAQKPKGIVGLTIPGMPASAPGMDMSPFKPYTVLAFNAKGETTEFAKHERA